MDKTDRDIARILQKNGRATHEQIARDVHLSRPAVHERIRRLEQDGVIQGYGAEVAWDAIGLPVTAFIFVRTSEACLPTARQILGLTSEAAVVQECHRVVGEWCLLVKVRTASSLALQDVLDEIRSISGVQHTMTTIALSEVVSETPEFTSPCGDDPLLAITDAPARKIREKR